MRIILLAICLLPSTFLLSQNLQDYPAPLPDYGQQSMLDSETILNDPLSFGQPAFSQMSNQRIAQIGQSPINEEDRLMFDSLIWEVYDEENDVWKFYSKNSYTRDERGNTLLNLYQLYDSESQSWQNSSKFERTFNEDNLETSYVKSTWDEGSESYVGVQKIIQQYNANQVRTFYERYNWNEEYEDWEGEYKYEAVYNEDNLVTTYSHYLSWSWDPKGWVGQSKSDYSYNDKNDQIETIGYDWSSELGDWKKSSKTIYVYNESSLLDTRTIYDWDDIDAQDWVVEDKIEYTYNQDGTINNSLHYTDSDLRLYWKIEHTYGDEPHEIQTNYSISDGESYKHHKDEYNYNNLEQILDHYSFVWEDGLWNLSSSSKNEWDGEGRSLSAEGAYWNDDLGKMQNSFKSIYEYNEYGEYTLYENYLWSEEKQSWYGTNATYTLFGENNYILDRKKYNDWDFETSSWVGENRYTYEVNDHNKRLSSDYYNWVEGDWKYTYRANYYFHLDCSSSSAPVANYLVLEDQTELCSVENLEAPTAIGCGGHLTATTDTEFPIETVGTHEVTWTYDDANGNTSSQTQNVIIDQSCQPLSVEDLNSLIKVYPNPSLGQVNFKQKIDEVEVFNQTGQLEMRVHSPGSSINVSKLKAGIYYLTLKYQTSTARVKIIKN